MIKRTNKIHGIVHSALLLTAFAGLIPSGSAQEKVAARTATQNGGDRSGSILSNRVEHVDIPTSVFEDTVDRRDPFFPDASYRILEAKPIEPEYAVGDDTILKQLKLNGFGGIGDKRWAMVNGVSIYQNESANVRVGGKIYPVTCLQLKDTSVVLGIKNTTARHELKLDQ